MTVALYLLSALVLPAWMVWWAVSAGRAARTAVAGKQASAKWAAQCAAARQAVEAIRGEVA